MRANDIAFLKIFRIFCIITAVENRPIFIRHKFFGTVNKIDIVFDNKDAVSPSCGLIEYLQLTVKNTPRPGR